MEVFICKMADVTETKTTIMAMQYTIARCQQSTVNGCLACDATVGLFHKFDGTLTFKARMYIVLDMHMILYPASSALRFYDPDVFCPLEIVVDELIKLGPPGIIFVYIIWHWDDYGRWTMGRWAFDL